MLPEKRTCLISIMRHFQHVGPLRLEYTMQFSSGWSCEDSFACLGHFIIIIVIFILVVFLLDTLIAVKSGYKLICSLYIQSARLSFQRISLSLQAKNHIEWCLVNYMSKKEAIEYLFINKKIDRHLTDLGTFLLIHFYVFCLYYIIQGCCR